MVDYSREEMIQLFGVDPDAAPSTNKLPTLPQAAASIGTDLGSIPTGMLSLLDVVPSAVGATYNAATTDQGWVDAYKKLSQAPDADAQRQAHIQQVAQQYRQAMPQMSPDNMQELINAYQKSKEYEEYNNTLASGPMTRATGIPASKWNAQTRSWLRSTMGDTRTNDELSWVDSALGAVATAGIGGPAGWASKAATLAPRVAANPVVRGALTTAEIVTPLSIPYTPVNVALNAAAGVGIDQAFRYAQGQSTAFSANADDAGIPAFAGIATATGALALAAGVLKGKSLANATPQSQLQQVIQNSPVAQAAQVAPLGQVPPGGAILNAGPPISQATNIGPQAGLGVQQKLGYQTLDEAYPARKIVEQQSDKAAAEQLEKIIAANTGANMSDMVHANTNTHLRELQDAIKAAGPQERDAAMQGWFMSDLAAKDRLLLKSVDDEIADLQAKGVAGKLDATGVAKLTDLMDSRTHFVNDVPGYRSAIENVNAITKFGIVNAFENGTEPGLVRIRNAIEKVVDDAIKREVAVGRRTVTEAAELRNTNRYYMPRWEDPFEGKTGFGRAWASVKQSFTEGTDWLGGKPVDMSPVRSLEKKIRKPGEARVNIVQDPMVALRKYVQNMEINNAHVTMRNATVRELAFDNQGNFTKWVTDNHMRRMEDHNGRTQFSNAEIRKQGTPANGWYKDRDTITTWDGGYASFWQFGDHELTALLRQDPVHFKGLINWAAHMNRIWKMNVTGALAPVFALKNMYYDTFVGALTHAPNRSFGALSYQAHKFLSPRMAKYFDMFPDPTLLASQPFNVMMGVYDIVRLPIMRALNNDVLKLGTIQAIAKSVGMRNWDGMVTRMLRSAEDSMTIHLLNRGVMYNSAMDDLPKVMKAMDQAKSMVPAIARDALSFWGSLVSAVHLAPKRQFFSENFALLERKHGVGNVPQQAIDNLVEETRTLAGSMTRRPANATMKNLDATVPYFPQARNGIYHMVRNMTDPQKAQYVLPRMAMMMTGVGTGFWMMQSWDDEARKTLWSMPDWQRNRTLFVPTPKLITAWIAGEKPAHDRDLYFMIPVPPDLAPMVAGVATMMQMLGLIPADATTKPLVEGMPRVFADTMTPAMPPAFQVPLAMMGAKLDPAGADTRGSALQQFQSLQKGPQSEGQTNLGQVSNTTSLVMNAMIGMNGNYLAHMIDAYLHAQKYLPRVDEGNLSVKRTSEVSFLEGMNKAMGYGFGEMINRVPDIPFLWQGQEKKYVSTPTWHTVTQDKRDINSIIGMRNAAQGKAANAERQRVVEAGGIPKEAIQDQIMLQIANEINAWGKGKSGPMYQLNEEYKALGQKRRGLDAQYNMPRNERLTKINELVAQQQEVMEHQRMAIIVMEQDIADRYGASLAPRLNGREVSMKNIDALMRESLGMKNFVAPAEDDASTGPPPS